MLVLDRNTTDQDLWLEIRPRFASPPAAASDLRQLHIELGGVSRVLRIEAGGRVQEKHLSALVDPLAESVVVAGSDALPGVDMFCRPSVTDAEGEMAASALGIAGAGDARCHAGTRYRFDRPVPVELRPAVERLLGNPLIHQFHWLDEEGGQPRTRNGTVAAPASEPVRAIDVSNAGDVELLAISRRFQLALDLDEMRAVADYFRSLGRQPDPGECREPDPGECRSATDVELQSIALTWSEHCSHKTFKAPILFEYEGQKSLIPGLLAEYLVWPTRQLNRPWVRSAFVDNAGVIAFDRRHDLAFKVETHNHPSALEPYGGAHTGVGGVIRDILAVSAEPIANTDVLCFGPLDLPDKEVPAGAFHPARTFREVVRGIAGYGNNMGIPTVGGAVLFHPGYIANPLVYCGTLGIAPRDSHPRRPQPGDRIVLLGGRTGRDGLHGATMSSETLDRELVAASTVQIGAPITEKVVRDVLPHLRDERLYHAITDCGAGGLCSAVGEMGEALGVDVDLARVPLKYEGLSPWEIWLSEAQERMILAVPDESLPRLEALCEAFGVEATAIGRFRSDGLLRLWHDDEIVADIGMDFLHGGRPVRQLQARWSDRRPKPYRSGDALDVAESLLRLLAHPNIASKEEVIRRYDHEVGAATVVKPLVGNNGPSDAAVLQPLPDSRRGAVIAHGINPLYGELDPHAMALLAVDEALRNLVAAGGSIDRAVLLDNFCWGDVDDPDELGGLVRAAQGCRDAALIYGAPFISGKDSLRNTSVDGQGRHSIPPTLLISALGVIPDVRRCVTMDLKRAGSRMYILGMTADELGGSHYLAVRGARGGTVPRVRSDETPKVMRALTRAIRRGLVLACHDLSEGGLAVAAAEMCLAGGLGMELNLDGMPAETDAAEAVLFAESPGRFLVEVSEEVAEGFEALFEEMPFGQLGRTTAESQLVVRQRGTMVLGLSVEEIEGAWKGASKPSARPNIDEPGRGVLNTPAVYPKADVVAGRRAGVSGTRWVTPPHTPSAGPSRQGSLPKAHCTRPRALVLAAAGVNCDRETVQACRLAGADAELVHLNELLGGRRSLNDFGMLVLAGGFSYGDHLGAGTMLATVLRHRFLPELQAFIAAGRPVLGICNGFQVLARLGLLGPVSLVSNESGRFECRWVPLKVAGGTRVDEPTRAGAAEPSPTDAVIPEGWESGIRCLFLEGLEDIELPIAHGEGRVVVPEAFCLPEVLTRAPLRYRENPNGSIAGIAGVCNDAGNVLGLMPHPERYVTPFQHPRRARISPAGLAIFRNAVRYVREAL